VPRATDPELFVGEYLKIAAIAAVAVIFVKLVASVAERIPGPVTLESVADALRHLAPGRDRRRLSDGPVHDRDLTRVARVLVSIGLRLTQENG